MIPNKIYHLLGYNSLGLMLDQERKHWLLKTDKKKWMQDKITGDVYQGQLDNIGTDIIIETEKLPLKYDMNAITWNDTTNADKVFSIAPSAFTYSSAVNGLMFARIASVNYPTTLTSLDDFHHYKIRFDNCQPCLIPFGGSNTTSDVFVGRWIKTTTPPTLVLLDDVGGYTDEIPIPFTDDITNVTYYYPLEETLQPIAITSPSSGVYITEGLTSNSYIGYPAFWFTCDKSNVGPSISIANNTNVLQQQLMMVGNPGNGSKYQAKLYVGVDGNLNCTPDGTPTSNSWYITCNPKGTNIFRNRPTDFDVPIDPSSILLGQHEFGITLTGDASVIKMSVNSAWEYVDNITYRIRLDTFDQNCLQVASNALLSVFDIAFDETIPFGHTTSDTGYAGIRMSASNDHSDIYAKYPHELNQWSGLPTHLQEMDSLSPEHLAVFAIHNTPSYQEGLPETRQTAALLFDPGKSKNDRSEAIIEKYNRTHVYVDAFLHAQPTSTEMEELIYWYDHRDDVDVSQIGYVIRMLPTFETLIPYDVWVTDPDTYSATYIWTGVIPDPPYDPDYTSEPYWTMALLRIIGIGCYTVFIEKDYVADISEVFENEERGRVYVLSNDSTEYVNNNATAYPKPERTVARICDIPTSAMQLNGITGLSPTQVVDPKYVRQEASYNFADKNRLYNTMASRFVRPNCYDAFGNIIQTDDTFVFASVDELNRVDLINHNNFRVLENLVPEVDPQDVVLASIYAEGTGYSVDDIGVIMVGGFAFNYIVTETSVVGGVTDLTIVPTKDVPIHLSNFEMVEGDEGITEPYGTSPTRGSGTGLRIRFRINHYDALRIRKGAIFDDLFALVRTNDGLWLYTYDIDTTSPDIFKTGTWNPSTLISQFENSTYGENGCLSSSEAMMVSMLPQRKQIPVCKQSVNVDPTSIDTLSTSTCINVIDTTKTPVKIPSNLPNKHATNQIEVDMTKFYCNGMLTLTATDRTTDAVFVEMKKNNLLRNNCYVFWRWLFSTGNDFQCGVIYRSLNNLVSTEQTTMLPKNDLEYPKYVETNATTSVVWDVPNVGVMMWVYDPSYKKCEKYSIDPETKDLHVDRITTSWNDIEIRNPNPSGQPLSLLDNSGRFLYNVWTNCYPYATEKTNESVYAQYKFTPIIVQDTALSVADTLHPLIGNWMLVFPRVHSFTFSNETRDVSYTPTKMQMIQGTNISDIGTVMDAVTGYTVDMSTMIVDKTANGSTIQLYNPETSKWETI